MQTITQVLLIFSSFILAKCITDGQFVSPCPEVFQYIPAEATANSWTGEITIKPDVDLSGVWMRIIFDNAPTELVVSILLG